MKIRVASVPFYLLGVRIDRIDLVTSALQLPIYCMAGCWKFRETPAMAMRFLLRNSVTCFGTFDILDTPGLPLFQEGRHLGRNFFLTPHQ